MTRSLGIRQVKSIVIRYKKIMRKYFRSNENVDKGAKQAYRAIFTPLSPSFKLKKLFKFNL